MIEPRPASFQKNPGAAEGGNTLMHYLVSQVGQYHIDADGDAAICQDSAGFDSLGDIAAIAVVADGIGSQKHSDRASKAAVDACVRYCKEYYGRTDTMTLLKNSFVEALKATIAEFDKLCLDLEDCTLCAAILTPDAVYCGNAGDSGVIGLMSDGRYVLLSDQENDADGAVFTLKWKNYWKFKKFPGRFSSIMVATDGFYDFLFPSYMDFWERCDPFDRTTRLDYETAARYMDLNVIKENLEGCAGIQQYAENLVNSIPRTGGEWIAIVDDLTLVTAFYGDVIPEACEAYAERIPRQRLMKENIVYNYSILYPDKELIEAGDRVYVVDKIIELPDECLLKMLSGDMIAFVYPKDALDAYDMPIDPEGFIVADGGECVARTIDVVNEGRTFAVVSKNGIGMIPLCRYFGYGRSMEVRMALVGSMLLNCKEFTRKHGWVPRLDEYRVFANTKGDSIISLGIHSVLGYKKYVETPGYRTPGHSGASDPNGKRIGDRSLLDVVYYILTGGQRMESAEAGLSGITKAFGKNSPITKSFSETIRLLESGEGFNFDAWGPATLAVGSPGEKSDGNIAAGPAGNAGNRPRVPGEISETGRNPMGGDGQSCEVLDSKKLPKYGFHKNQVVSPEPGEEDCLIAPDGGADSDPKPPSNGKQG